MYCTFCLLMQTSTLTMMRPSRIARIIPFISLWKAPGVPVSRSCSSGVWPCRLNVISPSPASTAAR